MSRFSFVYLKCVALTAGIASVLSASDAVAWPNAAERMDSYTQDGVEYYKLINPNVRDYSGPNSSISTGIWVNKGDRVWLAAGGCAQTGGSGRTWKRYVHNDTSIYYGMISIPGATNGLTWLGNYVSSETFPEGTTHRGGRDDQTIHWSNAISPFASASSGSGVISIGYWDDGYADNGYDAHDDGTDDQCWGVPGAVLWIAIAR